MKRSIKKVLIAGGTGFIGYHAMLKFRERGVEVGAFALPGEINLTGWYPQEVKLHYCDLFRVDKDEITEMVAADNYDAFVYALGPDERVTPPKPAFEFFHEKLVTQCLKINEAIKAAGIKTSVIISSYYAHFDRELKGRLSRWHPYIKARVDQENQLSELGSVDDFSIMFLELPFIFGTMPERKPLWKEHFLDHFAGFPLVFFPKNGGTAVIEVSGVAEAIVAACINGENRHRYQLGKVNLTYLEILMIMLLETHDRRKLWLLPVFVAGIAGWFMRLSELAKGRESGLRKDKLMTGILNRKLYVDPEKFMLELGFAELGYSGGKDVIMSIKETMKSLA